jgi:hypothetical protein
MVKVIEYERNKSFTVLVLPSFSLRIRIPTVRSGEDIADCEMYSRVTVGALGDEMVIGFESMVVFLAEVEVDGFALGLPPVEHDILIEAWAGFE